MKNLIIFFAFLSLFGCSKTRDLQPAPARLSVLLVGNWQGVKNGIIYTDKSGNQQTSPGTYTFNYTFDSSGNATKKASGGNLTSPVTVFTATYTITTTNGQNYLNLTINGTGTPPAVDVFKIATLTTSSLILTHDGSNGVAVNGTNAYIDEEYSK